MTSTALIVSGLTLQDMDNQRALIQQKSLDLSPKYSNLQSADYRTLSHTPITVNYYSFLILFSSPFLMRHSEWDQRQLLHHSHINWAFIPNTTAQYNVSMTDDHLSPGKMIHFILIGLKTIESFISHKNVPQTGSGPQTRGLGPKVYTTHLLFNTNLKK